ncbi:MAG: hypothetical protein Q8N55_02140 [bacterium]|nr:hypothetical protein [bacterium]
MADLSERLYDFALKIVQLVRVLPKEVTAFEVGREHQLRPIMRKLKQLLAEKILLIK